MNMEKKCFLCPRKCGADRTNQMGYCGMPAEIYIARAALHKFEEPVISGKNGSGTIFFCGCNLGCVYCQNSSISRSANLERTAAREVSVEELCDIMLRLRDEGAHNINLVTPTHYSDKIALALEKVKPKLGVPVIYNCGGYESVTALQRLCGLVDIYMPDFKYSSAERAKKYSFAEDYPERAEEAIVEMFKQCGAVVVGEDGLMKKGVLVRHLVLPGGRADSVEVLKRISRILPKEDILISLMRQYTPDFAPEGMKELRRKITSFEYDHVLSEAERCGFLGFSQERSAADPSFTPDFTIKTF